MVQSEMLVPHLQTGAGAAKTERARYPRVARVARLASIRIFVIILLGWTRNLYTCGARAKCYAQIVSRLPRYINALFV